MTAVEKQPSNASGSEGGRAYWNRHAKNYERSMLLLGRPVPRMVELAASAVQGTDRVLELAAGTGLVTVALAASAKKVIATDYADAMVSMVDARVREAGLSNVVCEQADIYALRYEPSSFDAVVAANVLHLVPDLPGALRAMRWALKPGGRLIVPTYCHDETALSWTVSRVLAVTGFPASRRFTARSFREMLANEGLRIYRSETLSGLIPIEYAEGSFDP